MPLTWLLLNSKSTMDLIEDTNMLVNIQKVQGKNAIRVHCNIRVKIMYWVGDLLATEMSVTNQQGSPTSF